MTYFLVNPHILEADYVYSYHTATNLSSLPSAYVQTNTLLASGGSSPSTATLTWADENLCTESADISDADWVKSSITAPSTKIVISSTSATAHQVISTATVPGLQYTFAFDTRRFGPAYAAGMKFAVWDNSNSTFLHNATYTPTDDWTTITTTITCPASCTQIWVYPVNTVTATGGLEIRNLRFYRIPNVSGKYIETTSSPIFDHPITNLYGFPPTLSIHHQNITTPTNNQMTGAALGDISGAGSLPTGWTWSAGGLTSATVTVAAINFHSIDITFNLSNSSGSTQTGALRLNSETVSGGDLLVTQFDYVFSAFIEGISKAYSEIETTASGTTVETTLEKANIFEVLPITTKQTVPGGDTTANWYIKFDLDDGDSMNSTLTLRHPQYVSGFTNGPLPRVSNTSGGSSTASAQTILSSTIPTFSPPFTIFIDCILQDKSSGNDWFYSVYDTTDTYRAGMYISSAGGLVGIQTFPGDSDSQSKTMTAGDRVKICMVITADYNVRFTRNASTSTGSLSPSATLEAVKWGLGDFAAALSTECVYVTNWWGRSVALSQAEAETLTTV